MKTELVIAVLSGVVAVGSAVMAYQSKLKVQKLDSDLELSLIERKPYFEQRKLGYEQLFNSSAMFSQRNDTLWELKVVEKENGESLKLSKLRSKASAEKNEAERLWSNARFRIAVYSNAAVVNATSDYLLKGNTLCFCNDTKKFKADVKIYQEIRKELGAPGNLVKDYNLAAVLFGCKFELGIPICGE